MLTPPSAYLKAALSRDPSVLEERSRAAAQRRTSAFAAKLEAQKESQKAAQRLRLDEERRNREAYVANMRSLFQMGPAESTPEAPPPPARSGPSAAARGPNASTPPALPPRRNGPRGGPLVASAAAAAAAATAAAEARGEKKPLLPSPAAWLEEVSTAAPSAAGGDGDEDFFLAGGGDDDALAVGGAWRGDGTCAASWCSSSSSDSPTSHRCGADGTVCRTRDDAVPQTTPTPSVAIAKPPTDAGSRGSGGGGGSSAALEARAQRPASASAVKASNRAASNVSSRLVAPSVHVAAVQRTAAAGAPTGPSSQRARVPTQSSVSVEPVPVVAATEPPPAPKSVATAPAESASAPSPTEQAVAGAVSGCVGASRRPLSLQPPPPPRVDSNPVGGNSYRGVAGGHAPSRGRHRQPPPARSQPAVSAAGRQGGPGGGAGANGTPAAVPSIKVPQSLRALVAEEEALQKSLLRLDFVEMQRQFSGKTPLWRAEPASVDPEMMDTKKEEMLNASLQRLDGLLAELRRREETPGTAPTAPTVAYNVDNGASAKASEDRRVCHRRDNVASSGRPSAGATPAPRSSSTGTTSGATSRGAPRGRAAVPTVRCPSSSAATRSARSVPPTQAQARGRGGSCSTGDG
eukprot:TRINITY_DN62103_c0_g1_i1.p1 TRINITY_DN62103_c0_g1~~TRINITY_DN62103_c0_g1_i1.p1  ORF type:complete len:633 (+),score=133.05 TRINITY_DN62103_c0_g1_i1:74-1972(+)